MAQDRWFRLIEDDLDDISVRVAQVKKNFNQRIFIFIVLIIAGTLMMFLGEDYSTVTIGVFVALTGVTGVMAISTMYHNQLCLYRSVIEMRRLQ